MDGSVKLGIHNGEIVAEMTEAPELVFTKVVNKDLIYIYIFLSLVKHQIMIPFLSFIISFSFFFLLNKI